MIKRFASYVENILVIDVESTCMVEVSEIIEIGLCDTEITFNESILIKPEYSIINDFCTELTSLTPDYISNNGKNYKEAYQDLNNISSGYSTWASYGDYDKRMFERMSDLYKININLPNKHINVRKMFANKVMQSNDYQEAPKNPKDALNKIGQEFSGFNHRGLDDARNISILLKLIK